jgi:hypothetical protein
LRIATTTTTETMITVKTDTIFAALLLLSWARDFPVSQ